MAETEKKDPPKPDHPEITPLQKMMSEMRSVEYLIRVLFNQDFITAETTNKKEIREKIEKLKAEADANATFTEKEKQEIQQEATKLDCLYAAAEYLREKIEDSKSTVFQKGAECGWEKLDTEDWREEFVEQATKCGKFQAKEAVKKTKNLREACAMAPTVEAELPSFGGAPPPGDLAATLERMRKKPKA